MSIINDTFKRLEEERSRSRGTPAADLVDADPLAGSGSAARSHRRTAVLLSILVFATACLAAYVALHQAPSPSVPPQPQTAIAQPQRPAAMQAGAQAQEPVAQPSWYADGWRAADAGKWPDAFTAWEDGLGKLPGDRMVISANGYTDLKVFSSALKKYLKLFPVIGVRQQLDGQVVYRLVAYPYGGASRQVLPRVQSLFPRAGLVYAPYVREHPAAAGDGVVRMEAPVHASGEVRPPPLAATTEKTAPPPVAVEGAHLSRASRMSFETMDAMGNDAAAASTPAEANIWANLSRAVRKQFREEAYAEAAGTAQTLARDFPERWESWYWLGTAQLAQGQAAAAESALDHAGKLGPDVARIRVQRAVAAQERGDHAAAVELLNQARALAPDMPQIYLNLGYSNDALGQPAEAVKNYQYFLTLTEGNVAYLLQRTLVIERLERKN